ncbi:MAG: Ser-Thr-rich GPI-anchored membrane family protein [Candidatus Omnitrophota bacterium]
MDNIALDYTSYEVAITAPNGGEKWTVSTPYNITWTATSRPGGGNYKLEYSLDSGTSWTEISSGTESTMPYAWSEGTSTATYSWVTPATASALVLVKVTDNNFTATNDASNAVFKLMGGFNLIIPNGGETWATGNSHDIFWSTTGTIANVKLEYSTDSGATWSDITASTANQSTYSWGVPLAAASTQSRIRVSDASDAEAYDISAADYTVQKATVTAPLAGARWQAGTSQSITWSSTGVANVKIEWSGDNFATANTIIASTAASAGSYTWGVPADFTTSTAVKVRVSSTTADSDGIYAQGASSAFAIYGALTLTSPNGGEEWAASSAHNITWTTDSGTIAAVKLEYSADNFGADINTITSSTANTGSFPWTPTAVGTTFKIRVSDAGDSLTNDRSNGYFSVTGIAISQPYGGVEWKVGEAKTIAWAWTGTIAYVKIEFYNGSGWAVLAASYANTGSYSWTVPDTITAGAKIKITSTADSAVTTTTDSFIIKGALAVTSPNTAVVWDVGDAHDITWTSAGTMGAVKLEYSADGGASWTTIIASTANTGTYAWTVADAITTQARVRVSDAVVGHPVAYDISDNNFTIQPKFTITAPLASSKWGVDGTYNITWTNTGTVDNVKIEYLAPGVTPAWTEIAASTANDGSFAWSVPDVVSPLGDEQTDGGRTQATRARITDIDGDNIGTVKTSDEFGLYWFKVIFHVKDSQTFNELAGLSVGCTSGWSITDYSLISPTTTRRNYKVSTYTTTFSRSTAVGVASGSASGWAADSDKEINVYVEDPMQAIIAYDVNTDFVYDLTNDRMNIGLWLEKRGLLVVNPAGETLVENAEVKIYDNEVLIKTLTDTTADTQGMFSLVWDTTGVEGNKVYFVKSSVYYQGSEYTSGGISNITVPIKLTATGGGGGTGGVTLTQLQTELSPIKTETDKIASLQTDMNQVKTAVGAGEAESLYSKVSNILTSVGAATDAASAGTLFGKIEGVRQEERGVILNRETEAKTGGAIKIRYQAASGLSGAGAPTITVYDPLNAAKVSAAAMTEIGTTGVYEYSLTLAAGWGLGEFTVICQESTNGTMDSMTLSVREIELADVYTDLITTKNNVATILSQTGDIAAIKTATDTINWDDITGLVTISGAIKLKTDTIDWTDIAAIKTKTDTIAWDDVVGIKSKTDTINWVDIAAIKAETDKIASLITKVNTVSSNLDSLITTVDNINTTVGAGTDTSGSDTLYGKVLAVREDIEGLDISGDKWGSYSAVDIIGYIDSLEGNLGTTSDTAGNSTVFGKLALVNSYIDSLEGLVGQATDAATASTLFGKIAGVSGAGGAGGTGGADTSQIEALIGAAADSAAAGTLFGKIANVAGLAGGIATASSFAQSASTAAENIRAELGAEGKTQTAYQAIERLGSVLAALKTSVEGVTGSEIDVGAIAAGVVNSLSAAAAQEAEAAGLSGIASGLEAGSAAEGDLTAIQNKLAEMEAMLKIIYEVTKKEDEKPVVESWFEE